MEVNNKRKLIVCIIAVLLILFIALFVKSCSKLIDDPRKGEKEALLYNDDELGDEDKLLVNGASVGRQTNLVYRNFYDLVELPLIIITDRRTFSLAWSLRELLKVMKPVELLHTEEIL
jgi:hypothetical protein